MKQVVHSVVTLALAAFAKAAYIDKIHNAFVEHRSTAKEVRQRVNGTTPTGTIQIGTPPVNVYMIFDTGSDLLVAKTWDTVQNELSRLDGGIDQMVRPTAKIYDHNASSTFAFTYDTVQGAKVKKQGYIAYGSGDAITDEGTDNIQVGGSKIEQFPVSEITRDSLSMLHTAKGVSGVLGLQHMKNGTMGESVFSRSRKEGSMTSFGYCRGKDNDGVFIWGDQSKEGQRLDVIGSIHWAISLSTVHVSRGKASVGTKAHIQHGSDKASDHSGSPQWKQHSSSSNNDSPERKHRNAAHKEHSSPERNQDGGAEHSGDDRSGRSKHDDVKVAGSSPDDASKPSADRASTSGQTASASASASTPTSAKDLPPGFVDDPAQMELRVGNSESTSFLLRAASLRRQSNHRHAPDITGFIDDPPDMNPPPAATLANVPTEDSAAAAEPAPTSAEESTPPLTVASAEQSATRTPVSETAKGADDGIVDDPADMNAAAEATPAKDDAAPADDVAATEKAAEASDVKDDAAQTEDATAPASAKDDAAPTEEAAEPRTVKKDAAETPLNDDASPLADDTARESAEQAPPASDGGSADNSVEKKTDLQLARGIRMSPIPPEDATLATEEQTPPANDAATPTEEAAESTSPTKADADPIEDDAAPTAEAAGSTDSSAQEKTNHEMEDEANAAAAEGKAATPAVEPEPETPPADTAPSSDNENSSKPAAADVNASKGEPAEQAGHTDAASNTTSAQRATNASASTAAAAKERDTLSAEEAQDKAARKKQEARDRQTATTPLESQGSSDIGGRFEDSLAVTSGEDITVPNSLLQGGAAQQGTPLCAGEKCVAIIDTGSNIIAGPSAAVKQLALHINVKSDCSNLHELPNLELDLGGFKVSLPGTAYVMKVKLPAWASHSKHSTHGSLILSTKGSRRTSIDGISEAGTAWHMAFEDLQKRTGVDLSLALEGVPMESLMSLTELCMPSFVPLDKMTAQGALFVIGTPLFDQYYVRWSWPQEQQSPELFVKPLAEANTCQASASLRERDHSEEVSRPPRAGSRLMRSESRASVAAEVPRAALVADARFDLQAVELDDIRYPHWVRNLSEL